MFLLEFNNIHVDRFKKYYQIHIVFRFFIILFYLLFLLHIIVNIIYIDFIIVLFDLLIYKLIFLKYQYISCFKLYKIVKLKNVFNVYIFLNSNM